MADETIKLAEALEHILANYEGDEDDPKWKEAREALDSLPPREMMLPCPQCKVLHVDEGEWREKPHKKHQCKFCGTRFEPCSFPTYGKGVDGMDAKEGTEFLNFVNGWLSQNGYPDDEAMTADVRYQMGIGWRAARDYWSIQFRKFMEKNAGKRVVKKKSGKKSPRVAKLQEPESDERDAQIAEEEGISF